MAGEDPRHVLVTNAIYLGVVVALMVVGLAIAWGAHVLLWRGDTSHEMMTLALGLGAAVPAVLFLIASGRAFSFRAKGVSLDVGQAAQEVAEDAGADDEHVVLPAQEDLRSIVRRLPRGAAPIVRIVLGTSRAEIEGAMKLLREEGRPPKVIALMKRTEPDQVLAQIDAPAFLHALGQKDDERAVKLFDAIERADAGQVRSNWFTSKVLENDQAADALGHMVREQLDVMILKDRQGKIKKVLERGALRERVLEQGLTR